MLVKVAGKDSDSVVSGLIARVQNLPQSVMASLTWDRGTELVYHRKFTVATDVSVSFCDPKSPWQRGSTENTNGLLRQYSPNVTVGVFISVVPPAPAVAEPMLTTVVDPDAPPVPRFKVLVMPVVLAPAPIP